MALVIQRPSADLIQAAADGFLIYGVFRKHLGRQEAFAQWCQALGLNQQQTTQLAMVRIHLIQKIHTGELVYDDIDWSGQDEDRRASSTGTIFVDSMESWLRAPDTAEA